MKDFFISYNKADRQWAVWIAWQLEEAGYSVIIQEWDFRPGGNFVMEMQKAINGTKKTIAVLSDSYLNSSFTQPEWGAAFADDPLGNSQKLLPVKVQDCKPTGLLKQTIHVSLFGVDGITAREKLLSALKDRGKPDQAPFFPGGIPTEPVALELREIRIEPLFPSAVSQNKKVKETLLQERLDNLRDDYKLLMQQISCTMNAVEVSRLERQTEFITKKMDEIAKDLDSLGD